MTLPQKHTHTPALPRSAHSSASERLRRASVSEALIGSCEPVSITGLQALCIRQESAAAPYAIVSVPCVITNPSKSCHRSRISAAASIQCCGVKSVLSSAKGCIACISASGRFTPESSSSADASGESPEPLSPLAMVPPVAINSSFSCDRSSPFRLRYERGLYLRVCPALGKFFKQHYLGYLAFQLPETGYFGAVKHSEGL